MNYIFEEEDLVVVAVEAIQSGNITALKKLLQDHPDLVMARIVSRDSEGEAASQNETSCTLLHVATDWPGHFPNGAETVRALIAAGAAVDARVSGPHSEAPLHWAASSNDVEVLQVLLDAGADINATGAVIAGGTPLDDAVAFAQWKAARLLVENGAQTKLWNTSALGMMEEMTDYYKGGQRPSAFETTQAFWLACHGGQFQAAEFLLDQDADLNWIGYDGLTPLDAAIRSGAEIELVDWLHKKGAHSAAEKV